MSKSEMLRTANFSLLAFICVDTHHRKLYKTLHAYKKEKVLNLNEILRADTVIPLTRATASIK